VKAKMLVGKKCHAQKYISGTVEDDDIQDYKRPWVGLTDEEVLEIIDDVIGFNSCWGPEEDFARAIEAKLKGKNT
jgi:hypothetical protein